MEIKLKKALCCLLQTCYTHWVAGKTSYMRFR